MPGEERLLAEPVLADPDGPPAGPDEHPRCASQRRAGAETFSNSTVTPSACRRTTAGPARWSGGADDRPVGDLGGGGVVGRAEHAGWIAHPLRGLEEHPAELAAADDAERGRRVSLQTRGDSPTDVGLLRAERPEPRGLSGYFRARIAAARSPALAAPLAPMASVPTGMPLGIWTIERSESTPRSILLSTGTPRTGRIVIAASIPGRWAAPPAPAIMTSSPGPRPPGRSGTAGRASGGPRRPAPRGGSRARPGPRPRAASSPSRTGSPSPRRPGRAGSRRGRESRAVEGMREVISVR